MAETTTSIFGKGRIPTDILHLKGRLFLFFSQPRELRDLIYDSTLDRKKRIRDTWPHEAYLYNLPEPNLLRLNRQFRQELLERIPLFAMMRLDVPRLEPLRKPLRLLSVAHVEMRVDVSHDLSSVRFAADGTKIYRIGTLLTDIVEPLVDSSPCLRSISINFYVATTRGILSLDERDEGRLRKCQDDVARLMAFGDGIVKGLDVYVGEAGKRQEVPWTGGNKEPVLCMKYSFEKGRLEGVDG